MTDPLVLFLSMILDTLELELKTPSKNRRRSHFVEQSKVESRRVGSIIGPLNLAATLRAGLEVDELSSDRNSETGRFEGSLTRETLERGIFEDSVEKKQKSIISPANSYGVLVSTFLQLIER